MPARHAKPSATERRSNLSTNELYGGIERLKNYNLPKGQSKKRMLASYLIPNCCAPIIHSRCSINGGLGSESFDRHAEPLSSFFAILKDADIDRRPVC